MISVSNSLQREYPGKFCVVRRGALPLHQSISSQRNRRSQIRLHPVQTGTSGWFQRRPQVLPVVSIFSHSQLFWVISHTIIKNKNLSKVKKIKKNLNYLSRKFKRTACISNIIFCNIINVLTVSFDQFNSYLLHKSINFAPRP